MLRYLNSLVLTLTLSACGYSEPNRYGEAQLAAIRAVEAGAVLIDVRSKAEFAAGHLDGALLIPHTHISEGVAELGLAKDTTIVLYCRSGNRSGQAMAALQRAGFQQVSNAGAYEALKAAKTALASETRTEQ